MRVCVIFFALALRVSVSVCILYVLLCNVYCVWYVRERRE